MNSKSTATKIRDKKAQMAQSNPTLMAAAFQDHLIRSMALTESLGPRKVIPGRATQRLMKKEIKPLVDTGRGLRNQTKKKHSNDREYVLDVKPPSLTLAQKLGLVEAPAQPMSEVEWETAKTKSNNREDSELPCVICKEDFGLHQQVLLSCTHVFHRACLEAFERFTGKKTCPMCRKEQYETRVIHEGAKKHRIKCATRIQAAWRGHIVRCWYKKLRESVPPKDPGLRQKFFENKLESITDRIVRSCDFNVGVFLTEIDRSLEASREIFRNFDALFQQFTEEDWENIQLKAVERGEKDCPICLTSLGHQETSEDEKMSSVKDRANENKVQKEKRNVKPFQRKYPDAGDVDITPLSMDDWVTTKIRKTVLLSCSHVFHLTCLDTFEELAVGDKKHICPVCRTKYQKRVLEVLNL